ncbi:hypothetical protein AVEN_59915-1 [Araneus ventricosus]|uniref:Uncharacterized protein n=1 Tax=Araneus ventricosus TaxID=182803 RepID=A0A4Y2EGS9_ARAVE|nr:hypothetical protein AVEN_59915-1 [Araneus ventricosus]
MLNRLQDKVNNVFDEIGNLSIILCFPVTVLCYYAGISLFTRCFMPGFPMSIMEWIFSFVAIINCFFVGTYFFMKRNKDLPPINRQQRHNMDRMFEFDS